MSDNQLNNDTALAVRIIADAAREAAKVVSEAALASSKNLEAKRDADHDLLIRLETKMQSMIEDIRSIRNDTVVRIETLEKTKMDKDAATDLELKIALLEKSKAEREFLIDLNNHVRVAMENRLATVEMKASKFLIVLSIYTLFTVALVSLIMKYFFKP